MSLIYGSWNIQNLSENHTGEFADVDVRVKWSIADVLVRTETDVMGVMEVVLNASGAHACKQIKETINEVIKLRKIIHRKFAVGISDRNVDESDTESRKADKYAVFYNTDKVAISGLKIVSRLYSFRDRIPLYYRATVTGGNFFDCFLWHAPNPSNMKVSAASELNQLRSVLLANHTAKVVMSGDFNMDTKDSRMSRLTQLGFKSTLAGLPTMLKGTDKFRQLAAAALSAGGHPPEDAIYALMMGNSYDNILVKGMSFSNPAVLNLGKLFFQNLYAYDLTGDRRHLLDHLTGRLSGARAVSDHCPIFASIA